MIYCQSASAYNKYLKEYLILPHKRYLQHISSHFQVTPNVQANTSHYLQHVAKGLNERDFYVALLIDEVYISRHLSFKANNIVGSAENNPSELAKTVQTFMIDKFLLQ